MKNFHTKPSVKRPHPLIGLMEEAKRSLSIAPDLFPDHPEADPNFSYVPVDHFFFANHEALTLLHLSQPKQAWDTLSQVDTIVSTALVPRRVELLTRQASASFGIGDLDQSISYAEQAGTSALKLGSDLRYSEACEVYQQMQLKWPLEHKIKALAELFRQ